MSDYDSYFSNQRIIRALCNIRLAKARAIHERRFSRKIFQLGPEDECSQINKILPPRKDWSRFRPRKQARKEITNPTIIALERCIRWHLQNSKNTKWVVKLDEFIRGIQENVLVECNYVFNTPNITAQHKKGNDYRAIASFYNLADKVVDILNAKYLREQLDISFEDSAVAFRGKRTRPLNRDTAIDSIFKMRIKHCDVPLYVTECDIRGFFDCVHHRCAKESLRAVIDTAKVRNPSVTIDKRAIQVFDSYLACYSFSKNVIPKEATLKRVTKNSQAVYKWPIGGRDVSKPDCLEFFHKSPKRANIGIPQGGAHSCLIANLVLDLADKELCLGLFRSTGSSLYLRYCDDIIIISTSLEACKSATKTYKHCLEFLKLPFHQAVELTGSLPQFYNDSKTKECYTWGLSSNNNHYPWVHFLGYHIKHDGEIRVRPSSLEKHKAKIDTLRESLCSELKKNHSKVSAKRIMYRFNSKVWAFSTGRVNPSLSQNTPLPMCWASGFRQLSKRKFRKKTIRDLDKHVGRNRRQLCRFLRKSRTGKKNESPSRRHLKYFGAPFSHLRQFSK